MLGRGRRFGMALLVRPCLWVCRLMGCWRMSVGVILLTIKNGLTQKLIFAREDVLSDRVGYWKLLQRVTVSSSQP